MGLGDHPETFLLKALCSQPPPSWSKVVGGWVGGGWVGGQDKQLHGRTFTVSDENRHTKKHFFKSITFFSQPHKRNMN